VRVRIVMARAQSTRMNGSSFTETTIEAVWQKSTPEPGKLKIFDRRINWLGMKDYLLSP